MSEPNNDHSALDRSGVAEERVRRSVLGVLIDVVSWDVAQSRIFRWVTDYESRCVCLCNAHSLVTTMGNRAFALAIHDADMATPDGMPVAWMLRRLGFGTQERICGPDLMWRVCAEAERRGDALYFLGATVATQTELRARLLEAFPKLNIVGMYSPPFRPLTEQEDGDLVKSINDSGARLLFVGLGCPKQEVWMAEHRGRIQSVMIGVGAAFSYHAGTLKRAPRWMQQRGLEWLYRLWAEPRRLWRRYFVTNTMFVVCAIQQLAREYVYDGKRK